MVKPLASVEPKRALKYFAALACNSSGVSVAASFASMSAAESSAACIFALVAFALLKSTAAPTKAMIGMMVSAKMTATFPFRSRTKARVA